VHACAPGIPVGRGIDLRLRELALARLVDQERDPGDGVGGVEQPEEGLQKDITMLIENLKKKFKYTEDGAKQLCTYAIENGLI
jgi:hypothetical protein